MKFTYIVALVFLAFAGYKFFGFDKPTAIAQPGKPGLTLLEIGFIPSLPPRGHASLKVEHTTSAGTSEISAFAEKTPLVIHFWAPWCAPCRAELPHFAKFVAANPSARIWCVADGDQTPQNIQAFYDAHKLAGLPVMIDKYQRLAHHLEVENLPTTIFLDRDGKERGRIVGQIAWHDADVSALILKELLS